MARDVSLSSKRSNACGPVAWFTNVIGRFLATVLARKRSSVSFRPVN